MKRIAIALGLAVLTLAHPAQASMTVVKTNCDVFEGRNKNGAWMRFNSGRQVAALDNRWSKRISSINIGPSCVMQMWDQPNFKGRTVVFEGASRARGLDATWNALQQWDNRAMSLKCHCNVRG